MVEREGVEPSAGATLLAARLTHEWIMQESNLLPYRYSSQVAPSNNRPAERVDDGNRTRTVPKHHQGHNLAQLTNICLVHSSLPTT
jgi:hypothetical protein